MSLAVDVSADGVRMPLGRDRVREIALLVLRAEKVREAMVSIAFVGDAAIARLNREHLGHRGPTDVISFALSPRGPGVLGDIYIAPGVATRNARAARTGIREEIARLVVHGVLHVAGHDHPDGEGRLESPMWRRQESLLRRAFDRVGW